MIFFMKGLSTPVLAWFGGEERACAVDFFSTMVIEKLDRHPFGIHAYNMSCRNN